ncbi:MAG: DUF2442 domain-containing protein [Ignavibacteriales bacterium]|nr:DUF2442 domain-containing protein [Ignavibacteriales bacterium]
MPRIIKVKYVTDYIIWLKFNDGSEGEVNLKDELWGTVFEELKDVKQFQKMQLHPELHTIVWENGADFSPEFLYEQLKVTA